MQDYHEFLEEILIPADELQTRIKELGEKISQDYEGKDFLLVCILRGGVVFLTDLMRYISSPHAIEFMAVSSYGVGNRETSGEVRVNYDLSSNITGRHILLVEDIIDSGNTLSSVLELLRIRKPLSLEVCTLLNKSERREVDIAIKYSGFEIPDKFVFGYGLDVDDYYRNLPFIGVVNLEKYSGI
ncbi:MAG: hypoxanthine phosphoribosyltransferase [Anaerolineaceae bacterium]|nr:hypoxanthine phosphoribosyltransferase [Anaerolineaceae bacterium]